MPEILFIAKGECVLALIDDLQTVLETTIRLETDYACGEERIFHVRPLAVFLERKMGEETCDSLTDQARSLLHGEAVPLILLSDDVEKPSHLDEDYEACFDLRLPLEELSRQVRQLLDTLPTIAWKDLFDEAQGLDGPIESDPSAVESGSSDADTCQSSEDTAVSDSSSSDSDPTGLIEEAELLDEVVFVVDPVTDPLASDPSPPPEPSHQDAPPPAPEGKPSPILQAASVLPPAPTSQTAADGPSEPSSDLPAASTPSPAQQERVRGASPKRAAYPAIAGRIGMSDTLPALEEGQTRPYRKAILWALALLLVLVGIASVQTYLPRDPLAGSSDNNRSRLDSASQATAPVPNQPAGSQLPKFIPQVAPDPQYAAAHPGWERYLAGGREYLVYREQDKVRAIQVLCEGGEITLPFFKECIRDSTGHEQFEIAKTELREELQVASGTLQNEGRFIIYRDIKGGEIRGFVLIFPAGLPG